MIAISSFRPFAQSAEIARNQARAFDSWLAVFDSIIYFGDREPRLASHQTIFIQSTQFPPIRLLVQTAALAHCAACIVNADIVLAPTARAALLGAMTKAKAATSFRYEFNPNQPFNPTKAVKIDNGLDLFIAHPAVWKACWREMPDAFRIGHPCWDSWLFVWLRDRWPFRDLTSQRLVFHPKHAERKRIT